MMESRPGALLNVRCADNQIERDRCLHHGKVIARKVELIALYRAVQGLWSGTAAIESEGAILNHRDTEAQRRLFVRIASLGLRVFVVNPNWFCYSTTRSSPLASSF